MKLVSLKAVLWLIALCPTMTLFGQVPRDRAWQMLHAGADDKSAGKRALAIRALGLLQGDSEALRLERKALIDTNPEVRAAAATALEQMHCAACIPDLQNALLDKDTSVVLAAARALHTLGDKSAYEVYFAILARERKAGNGLVAEQEAMLRNPKELAKFGFEQGIGFVPFGAIGWGAISTIAKDDASPVRASAALFLADDPDPQTGRALVEAISDKSWSVRVAALDAIAKRGDAKLLDSIVPALSDSRDAVRMTAAAAVVRLSSIRPTALISHPRKPVA